jgi:uncharacterized membrane protein
VKEVVVVLMAVVDPALVESSRGELIVIATTVEGIIVPY